MPKLEEDNARQEFLEPEQYEKLLEEVRNMKCAGVQDTVAMAISGHKTRSIFDRYNTTDDSDISNAAEKLSAYFTKRKKDRAAKLRRVK